MIMRKLDWSNHPYGSKWYKHRDGSPHPDDDNSYVWNEAAQEWQRDWDYDNDPTHSKP